MRHALFSFGVVGKHAGSTRVFLTKEERRGSKQVKSVQARGLRHAPTVIGIVWVLSLLRVLARLPRCFPREVLCS